MIYIGITGAAIILVSFIMNQMGKLSADSIQYDVANFVGSVLLLLYALEPASLPFIITNTVWGAFSLWGIIQYALTLSKKKR